jgi:hypothetical protein
MEDLQLLENALNMATQRGVFTMAEVVAVNNSIEKLKLQLNEKHNQINP